MLHSLWEHGCEPEFSCLKHFPVFACLWEHGRRLRCTHTMHSLTCMSVVVCVVRKLRPCNSYSRRRDRINSVLWRSYYKGGAGYPPPPHPSRPPKVFAHSWVSRFEQAAPSSFRLPKCIILLDCTVHVLQMDGDRRWAVNGFGFMHRCNDSGGGWVLPDGVVRYGGGDEEGQGVHGPHCQLLSGYRLHYTERLHRVPSMCSGEFGMPVGKVECNSLQPTGNRVACRLRR